MPDVTPGKVFATGEKVTRDKLNQLGAPTVTLTDADKLAIIEEVRVKVPYVNRTLLVNGGFNIWQRGGYATAGTYGLPTTLGGNSGPAYGPDRWYLGRTTDVNLRRISQGVFTPGQTEVSGEPHYYAKWEQLVNQATPTPCLSQHIEDVRATAGKTLTVSGWVKANKSLTLTIRCTQFTDTNLPVVAVVGTPQTFSIIGNAAWAQFAKTFTIPSLAGATLQDNRTSLEVRLEMPVSDTYEVDFANVQVEEASAATAFERVFAHDDEARAQRHFEYHQGVAWDDITHGPPSFYFATRKRIPPDLKLLAGFAGTMTVANFSTMLDTGYYQDTANSVVSVFFMQADAEFYT